MALPQWATVFLLFVQLLCTATFCEARCGWRHTNGCRAGGRRVARKDKNCETIIRPKWAGYCECDDGLKTEHFACGHEAFVCRVKCEELRSEQEAQKQARIDQAAQEAKEQQLASERAKEEAKQSAAAQAKAAAQAEEESKAAAAAAREREAEGQSNPTTPDIQPDSDDSGETDENAAETLENSEDISSADDEVARLPEPANIEQWEKATSEDGKTYWWNPETQETSWTDPSIAQSQLDGESPDESGDKTEGAGVAAEWREATSPEGKTYWWNTVTQETSWTDPAVVEEATQAPTMDPTPSSSAKRKLKPDRQKSYTPTPPVDAVGEDATGSEQVEQSTNTVPQGEIASSSEVNQAKAATVDDENPTPAPTRKESRRERRRRLAREKAAKKSQRSQSDDKAATPETTAPSSENGESSVDHAANSAVGGQSEQVIAQDNTQGDPANAATPAEESPVEASGEPAIAADAGQRALDEAVDSFAQAQADQSSESGKDSDEHEAAANDETGSETKGTDDARTSEAEEATQEAERRLAEATEAEREAAEEGAAKEAERQAAEEEAAKETERQAAEEEAAKEAERQVAEEAAKEAERQVAEEEATKEAERLAAEEETVKEAERQRAQQEAAEAAEQVAAEGEASKEAERKVLAEESEATRGSASRTTGDSCPACECSTETSCPVSADEVAEHEQRSAALELEVNRLNDEVSALRSVVREYHALLVANSKQAANLEAKALELLESGGMAQ